MIKHGVDLLPARRIVVALLIELPALDDCEPALPPPLLSRLLPHTYPSGLVGKTHRCYLASGTAPDGACSQPPPFPKRSLYGLLQDGGSSVTWCRRAEVSGLPPAVEGQAVARLRC